MQNNEFFDAVRAKDVQKVSDLIDMRLVDVNLKIDGWTALHHACALGCHDIVKKLLDAKANIAEQDPYGWSAVHHAAVADTGDCIHLLYKRGASIDTINHAANTATHIAAWKKNDYALKVLLKLGTKTQRLERRKQALQMAVIYNHPILVKALYEEWKVDLNTTYGPDLLTPLHYAWELEVAEQLITCGADPLVRSRDNKLPSEHPNMGKLSKTFLEPLEHGERRMAPIMSE